MSEFKKPYLLVIGQPALPSEQQPAKKETYITGKGFRTKQMGIVCPAAKLQTRLSNKNNK